MHARAMVKLSENKRIRIGVMDMYPDIVKQVDPKGHIMDVLIQHRVLSEQIAEELCRKETRQERCESMLQKLLLSEHPHAFIVLRTALQKDYSFILEKIGEATTGMLMTVLMCRVLVIALSCNSLISFCCTEHTLRFMSRFEDHYCFWHFQLKF